MVSFYPSFKRQEGVQDKPKLTFVDKHYSPPTAERPPEPGRPLSLKELGFLFGFMGQT